MAERVVIDFEGDEQDAVASIERLHRALERIEKSAYEAGRAADSIDVDLEDDIRQVQRMERSVAALNRELMQNAGLRFAPGGAGGGGGYVPNAPLTQAQALRGVGINDSAWNPQRTFWADQRGWLTQSWQTNEMGRFGLSGGDMRRGDVSAADVAMIRALGGGRGGGGRGGRIPGSGFFSYGSNDASLQAGDLFRGLLPGGARQSVGAMGMLGAGAVGLGAAGAPGALGLAGGAGAFLGATVANVSALAVAMRGLGDAIDGDYEAFQKLTPAAKEFVQEIRSFIPYMDHLRELTGTSGIWDGMADGLNNLLSEDMMANLERGLQAISSTLGSEMGITGAFLGSPEMADRLGDFLVNSTEWTRDFGSAIRDLFDAVTNLVDAGAPFLDWLSQGVADGAAWAEMMVDARIASGDFAGDMEKAQNSIEAFGDFIGSLIGFVKELGQALEGPALNALEQVGDALDHLARKIEENQEEIEAFVNGAINALAEAIEALWPWVETLIGGINDVVTAMGGWETAFELLITGLLATKVWGLVASFDALALGTGGGAIGRAATQAGLFSAAIAAIPKLIRIGISLEILKQLTGGSVDPMGWAWNAGAAAGDFFYDNVTSRLPGDFSDRGSGDDATTTATQSPLWQKTDKWLSNPRATFIRLPNGDVQVVGPSGTVWHTYDASDTSLSANAARARAKVPKKKQPSAASSYAEDRQETTESVPGGPGQDKLEKVLSYVKAYGPDSGITYTWGGASPEQGFDCSGFLAASYASAGVTIPHNAWAQFNDDNAIDVTGREQPGDGVYFKTGSGNQDPDHCGIYIGGGKFIEYYSKGKPARINSLGSKGGYRGARRWIKVSQAAASAAAKNTGFGPSSSGASTVPPPFDRNVPSATTPPSPPSGMDLLTSKERTALARAQRTEAAGDDIKVLQGIIGRLTGLSKKKKGEAKAYIEEQITDLQEMLDDAIARKRKQWYDEWWERNPYKEKESDGLLAGIFGVDQKTVDEAVKSAQKSLDELVDRFRDLAQQAADVVMNEFDLVTRSWESPIRKQMNAEREAKRDEDLKKSLEQAEKDLDEARKGRLVDSSAEQLRKIAELVAKYGLADKIAKVQAGVLGIKAIDVYDAEFARTVGNLAQPASSRVIDEEEIKRAEERVADIKFSIRMNEMEKAAKAQEDAWEKERADLRKHLEASLAMWVAFYEAKVLAGEDPAAAAAALLLTLQNIAEGKDPLSPVSLAPSGSIDAAISASANGGTTVKAREGGGTVVVPPATVLISFDDTSSWLRPFVKTTVVETVPEIMLAQGTELDRRRRDGGY